MQVGMAAFCPIDGAPDRCARETAAARDGMAGDRWSTYVTHHQPPALERW